MASLDEVTTSPWTEHSIAFSYTDPLSCRYDLPLFYKVLRVIGELLSVVVTVVGNVVTVAAVIRYRNLKTVTNNFVVSLSLADLLIVPSRAYYCYLLFSDDLLIWKLGIFLRVLPLTISQGISLYSLLLIAIDRYIAVNHPASYKIKLTRKRSFFMIALVWFFWMAQSVFVWTYYGLQADVAIFKEKRLTKAIPLAVNKFWITSTILFALGLTLVLYLRIFWVMRKQKARVGQLTTTTSSKSKKVTKMMATVLGVMLVCWLPYAIFSATNGWTDPSDPQYLRYIKYSCAFLLYTNSCTNPFLYAMMSPEFHKAYRRMFRRCWSRSTVGESDLHQTSVTLQTNTPH